MDSKPFMDYLQIVLSDMNISYNLQEKQIDILKHVTSEGQNHAFAVLPTGYGKSDIFGVYPRLYEELYEQSTKVLIISPLRSLMIDQVDRWGKKGLRCFALLSSGEMSEKTKEDLFAGEWDLLFASPEVIRAQKWRDLFRKYSLEISLFVLDEVHCMIDWGDTFRPEYHQVRRLRSILEEPTILFLTATVTRDMQRQIIQKMNMEINSVRTFAIVPDRPNIFLEIDNQQQADIMNKLGWYFQKLKMEKVLCPKAIIFVRQQKDMRDIFDAVTDVLGDDYWAGEGGEPGEGLAEIYYGQIDKISEKELPQMFKSKNSTCRCVIATIAFGLGIQIPDVSFVLHWGPSPSFLQYWQEVGRAGRDGRDAKAITYVPRRSLDKRLVKEDIRETIIKCEEVCVRRQVLKSLQIDDISDEDIENCCGGLKCCSYCRKSQLEKTSTDQEGLHLDAEAV